MTKYSVYLCGMKIVDSLSDTGLRFEGEATALIECLKSSWVGKIEISRPWLDMDHVLVSLHPMDGTGGRAFQDFLNAAMSAKQRVTRESN